MQHVQAVPVQKLRAVETFIPEYKKLTPEDVKNLERKTYQDFRAEFIKDPVKVMVEASDLGMNLSQYGNMIAPDTILEQKRSITARLSQDEKLYANDTELSAASTVVEYMETPARLALLFNILSNVWEKNGIGDRESLQRQSIQLQTSSPLHTPPGNLVTHGSPPPVQIGTNINPGELVSTTHSITTNSYSPFQWDYDSEDMKRTKVKPAETIPASTLGESSGNIPMAKWGNRFVLPYELLVGGQGMRINKLTAMVQMDAQAEMSRQYSEVVQALELGDGVIGAADIEGISAYGGTADSFGYVPYLNWLDESMEEPFQITHVLMRKEQMRNLRTAVAALDGDMALNQLNSIGLSPNMMTNMDMIGNIRYGRVPDDALSNSDHIVGIDARYALEKVNRAGMTIRQQAEQIANQTREVVISDTYLLARIAPEAVKVLDVGA